MVFYTGVTAMSAEAIEAMARLGIVADLQPAWLVLDGKTLLTQFGQDRTKYFQPYRTLFDQRIVVGGGLDPMQKIGSLQSDSALHAQQLLVIVVSTVG
jgi:predicted amidohydrolase YtcJ